MSDIMKVEGLVFGTGSFLDKDGALMQFQLGNCLATYRVRPLNAKRIMKLKKKKVDLDAIFPELEEFKIPAFDGAGDKKKLRLDDEGKIVMVQALRVKGGMNAWLAQNADAFADICEELIVSFDGVKREDESFVECNKDTIRGHGNFHEFVVKLLEAARLLNKAKVKNSQSLSGGKSGNPAEAGEPISAPVEMKA